MAEKRPTHLQVIRSEPTTSSRSDVPREDYWAQVRALRDERQRLRAG